MKCVHTLRTGRHKRQADITLLFQYMSKVCRRRNEIFVQPNILKHLTDCPDMTIAVGWGDKNDGLIFLLLGKFGGGDETCFSNH